MNYFEIGQRIRKYRKALKMSQEDIAESVGISTTHMSHIETGNTKLSLQVLVDISCVLNVSIDSLVFGKEVRNKQSTISEVNEIFEECSVKESDFLLDLLKDVSVLLKKHS